MTKIIDHNHGHHRGLDHYRSHEQPLHYQDHNHNYNNHDHEHDHDHQAKVGTVILVIITMMRNNSFHLHELVLWPGQTVVHDVGGDDLHQQQGQLLAALTLTIKSRLIII